MTAFKIYLSFAGVNKNGALNSCACKERSVELQDVSLVLFRYTQGRVWRTQRIS